MTPLLVSLSLTALLTAAFAFRFGYSERPLILFGFAALVFTTESIAQHYFMPAGAIGIEVAWICFPLAALFTGLTFVANRIDNADDRR